MDIYLIISILIWLAGIILFFYGIYGIIRWKGRRKIGVIICLAAITVMPILGTVAAILSSNLQKEYQEAAQKSGFKSVEEYKAANSAGKTTPEEYRAYLKKKEAERIRTEEARAKKEAARKLKEQQEKNERLQVAAEAVERERLKAAEAEERKRQKKALDYIARVERELASLRSFDTNEFTTSIVQITIGTALFNAYATIIDDSRFYALTKPDIVKVRKLTNLIKKRQRRVFPILRDAYGPLMRQKLWEHDITARTIGKGFRTIEFVGGVFAANKNKKDFQEKLHDTLGQLRFKRSQYKWFKGASEYTYFTISSPKDSDLIIWTGNGQYREIK